MTNDELLARVEGLTGPDREVDAAIYSAILGAKVWFYDDNNHIDAQIKNGNYRGDRQLHPDFDPNPRVTWRYKIGDDYGELPELTDSIDADLALVERELPGWHVQLTQLPDHWAASLWDSNTDMGMERFPGKTACAAILLALLRARAKSGDGR